MDYCPICYTKLEIKECAPCDDCGCNDIEIVHFYEHIHTYTTYNILGLGKLTLCDFCVVDFASYTPLFWQSPTNRRITLEDFEYACIPQNTQIVQDKFCPTCNSRSRFLQFVIHVREHFNNMSIS